MPMRFATSRCRSRAWDRGLNARIDGFPRKPGRPGVVTLLRNHNFDVLSPNDFQHVNMHLYQHNHHGAVHDKRGLRGWRQLLRELGSVCVRLMP
jgi:hypothetical protein